MQIIQDIRIQERMNDENDGCPAKSRRHSYFVATDAGKITSVVGGVTRLHVVTTEKKKRAIQMIMSYRRL